MESLKGFDTWMSSSEKGMRSMSRERLKEMVVVLRDQINSGKYAPGEYLPSEKEFVQQFNLSNKSVRKGLDQLVEEDLIVKVNRVGSKVKERHLQEDAITLTLGCSFSIERDIALSRLLEDFHAMHPDIVVKTITITLTDYMSPVKEYLENGLIDVFTQNNLHFQELVEGGLTHLLEPVELQEAVYPFLKDMFLENGISYAQPIIFTPIVLAYNRIHFQERNVPEPDGSWTWEDVIRHAISLSIPGERYGLYFYLMSEFRWPSFLLQGISNPDSRHPGRVDLERHGMMEGIRLTKRIIQNDHIFPHYMSENSYDVDELFVQGKVSMILTNYLKMNDLKSSEIDFDISPFPHMGEPRSLTHAIGVSVNRSCKEKEAALKLANYLVSPRAQRMIRSQTFSIPTIKEIAEARNEPQTIPNTPSRYFLFKEIAASFRSHNELKLSVREFNALRQLLKKYWSDMIDEEQLIQMFNELMDSEL
jgi:multiple sugar transport system substrate-binding protein